MCRGTKASRVFAALLRIGWSVKRHVRGSHRVLARPNWPDVVFAFHDSDEIGPHSEAYRSQARRLVKYAASWSGVRQALGL